MTANNFGYGQQDPSDNTSEFNRISFLVNRILARVRTMVIVRVEAVDEAAATVDVRPLVNQVDGNGNSTPHGVVFGLPYFGLQGGANSILIVPAVGDIGLAIVSDRDISAIKETKAPANPGSLRRFSLPDAVYLGGILGGTPDQTVRFTATGIAITDKNGNTITTSAAGINITDKNANQIQMVAGFVNIVTPVLKVNGIPVTIP